MARVYVALLGLIGVAIVGVQVVNREASAVETSVRRYAAAVSTADLEAAVAEIAPDQRDRWRGWVAGQLGNVYDVRGVAVRTRSLLGPPVEVTVVMDVNRDFAGEFYQPTPRVPVEEVEGRPYLAAPLLASP